MGNELQIALEQQTAPDGQTVSIMRLAGRVDFYQSNTLQELQDFVNRLLAQGVRRLIIDFRACEYLDVELLPGTLVVLTAAWQEAQGQLRLIGLPPKYQRILEFNETIKLLQVYPNEEAALNF